MRLDELKPASTSPFPGDGASGIVPRARESVDEVINRIRREVNMEGPLQVHIHRQGDRPDKEEGSRGVGVQEHFVPTRRELPPAKPRPDIPLNLEVHRSPYKVIEAAHCFGSRPAAHNRCSHGQQYIFLMDPATGETQKRHYSTDRFDHGYGAVCEDAC